MPPSLIRLIVYYDEDAPSERSPESLRVMLDELMSEGKVYSVSMVKRGQLTEAQIAGVAEKIRSIRPQNRGSVVASGGDVLPLSGSKKLNLGNTPVLLVEKMGDGNVGLPVYVFPCRVGENYYGVLDGLRFLGEHLPDLADLPAWGEESIVREIVKHPEILENGLAIKSSEIETSTGRGDLLLCDSSGRLLLIEVERDATDQAVGQILRLCAGYEKENGLEFGSVRAGIVCFRINEHVLAAARRAKVEVWRMMKKKAGIEGEGAADRPEYFPP